MSTTRLWVCTRIVDIYSLYVLFRRSSIAICSRLYIYHAGVCYSLTAILCSRLHTLLPSAFSFVRRASYLSLSDVTYLLALLAVCNRSVWIRLVFLSLTSLVRLLPLALLWSPLSDSIFSIHLDIWIFIGASPCLICLVFVLRVSPAYIYKVCVVCDVILHFRAHYILGFIPIIYSCAVLWAWVDVASCNLRTVVSRNRLANRMAEILLLYVLLRICYQVPYPVLL